MTLRTTWPATRICRWGLALTHTVTGLTYGTEYYYRLRAENSGGLSVNSTTQSAWTVPSAPVAQAATEALTNDFTAHWNEALSATNYLLDVSVTNDFTSMVAVYTNLSVGNVTNYSVTGLTPALTYYYRLRAQNPGGISTNSNVQFLTLLKGQQTITNFTHIGDQIVTNTVHLEAQASSGLPVSFIPTRGAELTMISGGTNLTFTGTGVVEITAIQFGDESWYMSPMTSQTFEVTAVVYTLTPSSGANGSINPANPVTLYAGENTGFVVRADADYYIASLATNGAPVGGVAGLYVYTSWWNHVQADGTITATFASVINDTAIHGTPVPWLRQYYPDALDLEALKELAQRDTDGDQMLTWEEYWSKTNPTDSNNYLHITWIQGASTSTGSVIRWTSETDVVYRLTRSTNLLTDPFTALVHPNVTATPPINVITDETATSETLLYYRIGVER